MFDFLVFNLKLHPKGERLEDSGYDSKSGQQI